LAAVSAALTGAEKLAMLAASRARLNPEIPALKLFIVAFSKNDGSGAAWQWNPPAAATRIDATDIAHSLRHCERHADSAGQ
jgi:hypothetical protein